MAADSRHRDAAVPSETVPLRAAAGSASLNNTLAAASGRLVVPQALADGWRAFCRAPRVFVAFALLVTLLQGTVHPLTALIGSRADPSDDPRAWLLYALGLGFSLILNLWALLSLVRAAWIALAGGRPTLALLLRWDGPGCRRLLLGWLHLLRLIALPLLRAILLLGGPLLLLTLPQLQRSLGQSLVRLLALALALLLLIALVLALLDAIQQLLRQTLLVQVVALEGLEGRQAVDRGQQLLDPQATEVLLLVLCELLLYGLGLAACVVGVLVAWPTVICISTAAYRQLRQAESPAGRGAGSAAHRD